MVEVVPRATAPFYGVTEKEQNGKACSKALSGAKEG
jgi:hypothetical protein